MTIDLSTAGLLGLLVSVVLPVLVGLVTKWSTTSAVKSLLLIAFTVLTSGLTTLISSLDDHQPGFSYARWALTLAIYYALAVASHYGLWAPSGVSALAKSALVKDKAPDAVQYPTEHGGRGTT